VDLSIIAGMCRVPCLPRCQKDCTTHCHHFC